MNNTLYLFAADALLLSHAAFVLFIVVGLACIIIGKFREWSWVRNPWLRAVHMAGIVFVMLQSWLGKSCPLTVWEMALRQKAGAAIYEGSFIAHWVESILYYSAPAWVFVTSIHSVCGSGNCELDMGASAAVPRYGGATKRLS